METIRALTEVHRGLLVGQYLQQVSVSYVNIVGGRRHVKGGHRILYVYIDKIEDSIYVYMYTGLYTYIYICWVLYVYIYVHIYIYIYIYIFSVIIVVIIAMTRLWALLKPFYEIHDLWAYQNC